MKKLALIIACLALVACSTIKHDDVTGSVVKPVVNDSPIVADDTPLANEKGETVTLGDESAADDIAAHLSKSLTFNESVFFDYDQYAIKPEAAGLLQDYAEVISKYGLTVILEGNADERGSLGYNFALGEKRANSVKKALVLMGVSPDSIKVVSNGNTSPRATCHDESCWHINRRVDFIRAGQ